MSRQLRFPEGFLWGAATSAHQVEGNQDNDWTAWERQGKIRDGSVSGPACDHWQRFETDFDLAKKLGHTAHRFSVEWSRVEPRPGEWQAEVLDHYRQVVSALRQRGIEPFVTLWHFTNPRWLAERGGWEWSGAPQAFARYVERMVQSLPEVRFWLTLNEPNVYAILGYLAGEWYPEVRSVSRAFRVHENLVRGHRLAWKAIKQLRSETSVGLAQNLMFLEPARPKSWLDRWSARTADQWYNRRFLNRARMALDFLGVNHYHHQLIRFRSVRDPIGYEPQGQPQTDFGWQIYPASMYRVLRLAGEYGLPVYITENGLADARDQWRRQYLQNYLAQVHRAIAAGVDVRGYLHWSLLDNFEWREGFSKRFGLIEVDFSTQERRIRPSAEWFAEVCRRNAVAVGE